MVQSAHKFETRHKIVNRGLLQALEISNPQADRSLAYKLMSLRPGYNGRPIFTEETQGGDDDSAGRVQYSVMGCAIVQVRTAVVEGVCFLCVLASFFFVRVFCL